MYIVSRPATYAAHVLFSLFKSTSALPTASPDLKQTTGFSIDATLGLENETLIRLPKGIPWSPETSTFQASIPYPVPDTAITLNFTHFGFPIPVVRALSTIYDAREQVLSHLLPKPEDITKSNVFDYSTRSNSSAPRDCVVTVQAYGDLELSWLQLDQILAGLAQFSSGAGIDHQVHYQALGFDVNLSGERIIGIGLLWCTPSQHRGAVEAENRAAIPNADLELGKRSNPPPRLVNETTPIPSNTSNPLSSFIAEIPFPVPGTSISLNFVWFGSPIPSKMVDEALNGALRKITPFLKRSGSAQIPHDRFFYTTPAGKVRVLIQIYGTIHMNWSQVNSILAGLYRFTNGIGTAHEEEHFENLGFDVKDEEDGTIGYGNFIAVPARSRQAISAVDGKRSTPISPPPNSTLLPQLYDLSTLPPSTPYIYPIPHSDLNLLFTYIGAPLPTNDVNAALLTAQQRIRPAILTIPDQPIAESGFENHAGSVSIVVTPYEGAELTWRQLHEVLRGLAGFCQLPYARMVVFDVEGEGFGRVGAGRLWPVGREEVGVVRRGER